ncbi:homoserine kinase [Catelliglobosispora koreensis]|uniref:homoserine kinase n=1 Tax=Catelliglobosispora koreensis TaxID=129052 RepID=UPI000373400F
MVRVTAFTVRVPATSANLGPGFDALGLALSLYDEVTARVTAEPTTVRVTGEGAGDLAKDEEHLVIKAMRETFAEIGEQPAGIELTCVNAIPQARGLGSSSAAIVAGVTLANALSGGKLSQEDELRIAGRLEGHPDNVAPCLLGGFTIAWTSHDGARAVSTEVHPAVQPALFVPANRGLTKEARAALPASVPHADASFNAGRSALLVYALTKDPSLLFEATEDRLHQDYRAPGMPESAALVKKLRGRKIAAVISGAGPTVLALSGIPADFAGESGWVCHTLAPESAGARVRPGNISSTLGHAE